MIVSKTPKRLREYRFVADLEGNDLVAFREELVDLAGGFTEIHTEAGTRYIVGLRGRDAKHSILKLLGKWEARTKKGKIDIEDRATASDPNEIYFLLPLRRNPDRAGGLRLPAFTNEELAALRMKLAHKFHFRPVMVQVYGEWRNDTGELIPDDSVLIHVPYRNQRTITLLRAFLKLEVLASETCDQDCLYLSYRWRGEFVPRP